MDAAPGFATEHAATRAGAAAAAIAFAPALLLLDTGLAFARGWWTSNGTWMAIVAGSSIVLLAVAAALLTARGRAFLARHAARLALITASAIASWLLLEGVLSVLLGPTIWVHRNPPLTRAVFHPDPRQCPGVFGEARYSINSLGIRGPELPPRDAAVRILCMGGSTTACMYLDDDETWTALLARELGTLDGRPVWTGDIGMNGYGSWHHVRFLDESDLAAQFDWLVVLVGINDFLRVVQGRRIDTAVGARPVWDQSVVFALLHNVYQRRKEQRIIVEEDDAKSMDLRRDVRQRAAVLHELPDLRAGLAQYRTNLRSIIALARARGVRPVFATQPVLWSAALPPDLDRLCWLGTAGEGVTLAMARLTEGMAAFNAALREVCAEEAVPSIDLTPMDGDPRWFYDDCHFSEAGAREVARRIAAGFPRAGTR